MNQKETMELLATEILNINSEAIGDENKPNFSNRDFMNAVIIFQNALMDKMFDNQNYDNMSVEERLKMAESCGNELRKFVYTYTNLDIHKFEDFI